MMQMRLFVLLPSAIFLAAATQLLPTANAQKKLTRRLASVSAVVGGRKTATKPKRTRGGKIIDAVNDEDVHLLLARSIQKRLNNASPSSSSTYTVDSNYDIDSISKALRSISSTQAALKKIDGTAHEMYQRTHKSSTTLGEEDENDEWDNDRGEEEEEEEDNDGGNSSSSGNKKKKTKTKLGGLKVAGRMSRNAARIGCIADALFAAELCELLQGDHSYSNNAQVGEEDNRLLPAHNVDEDEGTLASWTGRQVVLNTTIYSDDDDSTSDQRNHHRLAISILVIYERDYDGGAGRKHGGVDDLLSSTKEDLEEEIEDGDDEPPTRPIPKNNATDDEISRSRGRYLIVLSDHFENTIQSARSMNDLPLIISTLDTRPEKLRLNSKQQYQDMVRSSGGSASVCGPLYDMARKVVETIQPVLDMESRSAADDNNADVDNANETVNEKGSRKRNADAQSMKAAIHFVGYSLAGGVAAISACIMEGTLPCLQHKASTSKKQQQSLTGVGASRTSALCIGPPPCLSSNMQSDFITSVIHGDDIVCRTTQGTINHLCDRIRRTIKGGILGRSVGWMGEAVSLTVSGLKGNNNNSNNDKTEAALVVPGNVYLVRPRRLGGGSSSIHEISGRGGRESLRAALLWQLNDVLVSKSLWAHHRLDAYIHSLDKVRLKGFADDPTSENESY